MQKHYNYLTVDLDKKTYQRVKATQGDTKSRFIIVDLIGSNMAYDLTDTTVKVYAVKSDNKKIFNNATILDYKNGKIEIELTNQALAVVGQVKMQILVLGKSQEILTSGIFYVDVEESIVDGNAIQSTNEFNAFTKGLTNLAEYDIYKQNVDDLTTQFKELVIEAGDSNAEIVASRGGYGYLPDRLNNYDSQFKQSNQNFDEIDQRFTDIDEQFNAKANISDIKTEVVSNRVRGQNSPSSPAGAFDFANFAQQGNETGIASTPIGGVIHHYTDGKVVQIDNVGENNVILTMVNANNPTRRPDKDSTFYGTGYFMQLFTNNQNTNGVYDHLTIDQNGMLFWSGYTPTGLKTNSTTFTTGKDYGYTPAFILNAIKEHENILQLKTNSLYVLDLKYNKSALCGEISTPSQMDGLNVITNKGDIRLQPFTGKSVRISNNAYINKQDGRGAKEVAVIDYGTTSERPTTNLQCGLMFFDRTLNKPIWRNKDNNGWVDATGTTV